MRRNMASGVFCMKLLNRLLKGPSSVSALALSFHWSPNLTRVKKAKRPSSEVLLS